MSKLDELAKAASKHQDELSSGAAGVPTLVPVKENRPLVNTLIGFDPDEKERLFQYAHRVGKSQAEVVRTAVSTYLDDVER